MQRGWVGRLEGDRVIHLAAQTLQHFFSGGSSSREHDVYALEGVAMLVPVLHPPAVRVFEDESTFAFANPAAVFGPDAIVSTPAGMNPEIHVRLAGIVGAEGVLGGVGLFVEVRGTGGAGSPKDRDFGSVFGPVVVTPDEGVPGRVELSGDAGELWSGSLEGVDWDEMSRLAGQNTVLRTGDLLVSPAAVVLSARGAFRLAGPELGNLDFVIR